MNLPVQTRREVEDCALARIGGVATTRLLGRAELAGLQREALTLSPTATEARRREPGRSGGDPDRWLDSSPGGPTLQAFYRSKVVLGILAAATGLPWEALPGSGTYSYYRRCGHHLGLVLPPV